MDDGEVQSNVIKMSWILDEDTLLKLKSKTVGKLSGESTLYKS
jgi:hypothetical protein